MDYVLKDKIPFRVEKKKVILELGYSAFIEAIDIIVASTILEALYRLPKCYRDFEIIYESDDFGYILANKSLNTDGAMRNGELFSSRYVRKQS